jgi:ribosomal protein S18 acetylase RimI-like enzyme
LVLADPGPTRRLASEPFAPGLAIERLAGIQGRAAERAAAAVVEVLVDAFDVGVERSPGVVAETIASLGRVSFTHYLVRREGRPVAVARRATFDGVSYLSSIGTASAARGQGFGRLVTSAAACDAVAAGSEWTHLGVFADNREAIQLYRNLGFEQVGEPCPDLILV